MNRICQLSFILKKSIFLTVWLLHNVREGVASGDGCLGITFNSPAHSRKLIINAPVASSAGPGSLLTQRSKGRPHFACHLHIPKQDLQDTKLYVLSSYPHKCRLGISNWPRRSGACLSPPVMTMCLPRMQRFMKCAFWQSLLEDCELRHRNLTAPHIYL